jgi:nitroreductase
MTLPVDRETLLAAWHFRHACKRFDPNRRIPDDDFAAILEAGRLSPSSFGFEPWRFLIIEDRPLREKLRAVTWGGQGQLPTASHVVVLLARRDMRWDSDYLLRHMREVKRLDEAAIDARRERVQRFQESDFRLLDHPDGVFEWSCRQVYIALANMMMAAALLEIDSCPIEGFQRAEVEALLDNEGLLDPAVWGVAVMAAFGYRVDPAPTKTRWPHEEVVVWVKEKVRR